MGTLVLTGLTSGSTTVQPTNAVTATITLPSTTSTLATVAQIQGPAFSANLSVNQSVSAGVWTKIALNAKAFDTNSCFDNVTNYRFTPNVAGYYQIQGNLVSSPAANELVAIYKNGSLFAYGPNPTSTGGCNVFTFMYFNGTTDYVELYGYLGSSGSWLGTNSAYSYFQGFLARTA